MKHEYRNEMSCNTCKRVNDCREECLREVSEFYVHPEYPQYKRKYGTFAYDYWIPWEIWEPTNEFILTDEDFEL
jgi:hypothetical protein